MQPDQLKNNSKRIAKNTLFLYLRQILVMLVALYTSRVVLRVLGVVDYGVYNVVGGMVSMFAFLNAALAQATERFIAFGIAKDTIEQQRKTFSMLLNVHIIMALLLFVLCESVGLWFFYNKLVIPSERLDAAFWVMQCSIFTLMISVTQVPYNASIFGHEHMNAYAYISIIEVMLKLGIVILLQYAFTDKLIAYGILLALIQFVVAMIYRIYCLHKFDNCKYKFYWSQSLFKKLFGYSGWSLIGNFAWTLNGQGMNMLINMFFGPLFNAAKGISNNVQSAVTSFATNFLGASIPQIIKSYASGDYEYCFKVNFKSGKFGFFLFMLISLPIISIIRPLLEIWLVNPPKYAVEFSVFSLLYVQANTMGGTLQNVAQATGKIRNFQLANGGVMLLVVPVVYVIYKMGGPAISFLYVLIGTSISCLFAELIALKSILPIYPVKRYLIEVTLREIATFAIPCILALILYKMSFSYIVSFAIAGAMFLFSFFMIWIIGFTKSERTWAKNIILNKIKR